MLSLTNKTRPSENYLFKTFTFAGSIFRGPSLRKIFVKYSVRVNANTNLGALVMTFGNTPLKNACGPSTRQIFIKILNPLTLESNDLF